MSGERVHLGDDVYARHDGYYLWVEAERVRSAPGTTGAPVLHQVALEPDVLVALVRHAVKVEPGLAGPLIRAAGGEAR